MKNVEKERGQDKKKDLYTNGAKEGKKHKTKGLH